MTTDTIYILFIDDEGFWAKPYRERLEEEFDVHYSDDPADGREFFAKTPRIDIIILDIMMPTPDGVDPRETDEGLDTGLWLLREMRGELIDRRVPVLILTNRRRAIVDEAVAHADFPAGLIEVRLKSETPAFFLPSRVHAMVTRWRR